MNIRYQAGPLRQYKACSTIQKRYPCFYRNAEWVLIFFRLLCAALYRLQTFHPPSPKATFAHPSKPVDASNIFVPFTQTTPAFIFCARPRQRFIHSRLMQQDHSASHSPFRCFGRTKGRRHKNGAKNFFLHQRIRRPQARYKRCGK